MTQRMPSAPSDSQHTLFRFGFCKRRVATVVSLLQGFRDHRPLSCGEIAGSFSCVGLLFSLSVREPGLCGPCGPSAEHKDSHPLTLRTPTLTKEKTPTSNSKETTCSF